MKDVRDPIQIARVQSLFSICKKHVRGTQIALDKYKEVDSVDKRSKGFRALLRQLRYVYSTSLLRKGVRICWYLSFVDRRKQTAAWIR